MDAAAKVRREFPDAQVRVWPYVPLPEPESQDKPASPITPTCGKPAASLIPRWGMSYACVLPPTHEGPCKPGGDCIAHGRYTAEEDGPPQCPKCVADNYAEANRLAANTPAPQRQVPLSTEPASDRTAEMEKSDLRETAARLAHAISCYDGDIENARRGRPQVDWAKFDKNQPWCKPYFDVADDLIIPFASAEVARALQNKPREGRWGNSADWLRTREKIDKREIECECDCTSVRGSHDCPIHGDRATSPSAETARAVAEERRECAKRIQEVIDGCLREADGENGGAQRHHVASGHVTLLEANGMVIQQGEDIIKIIREYAIKTWDYPPDRVVSYDDAAIHSRTQKEGGQ